MRTALAFPQFSLVAQTLRLMSLTLPEAANSAEHGGADPLVGVPSGPGRPRPAAGTTGSASYQARAGRRGRLPRTGGPARIGANLEPVSPQTTPMGCDGGSRVSNILGSNRLKLALMKGPAPPMVQDGRWDPK